MNTDKGNQLVLAKEIGEIISCSFEVLNYLKITGLSVGLIINFKHAKLEWKRVVR